MNLLCGAILISLFSILSTSDAKYIDYHRIELSSMPLKLYSTSELELPFSSIFGNMQYLNDYGVLAKLQPTIRSITVDPEPLTSPFKTYYFPIVTHHNDTKTTINAHLDINLYHKFLSSNDQYEKSPKITLFTSKGDISYIPHLDEINVKNERTRHNIPVIGYGHYKNRARNELPSYLKTDFQLDFKSNKSVIHEKNAKYDKKRKNFIKKNEKTTTNHWIDIITDIKYKSNYLLSEIRLITFDTLSPFTRVPFRLYNMIMMQLEEDTTVIYKIPVTKHIDTKVNSYIYGANCNELSTPLIFAKATNEYVIPLNTQKSYGDICIIPIVPTIRKEITFGTTFFESNDIIFQTYLGEIIKGSLKESSRFTLSS